MIKKTLRAALIISSLVLVNVPCQGTLPLGACQLQVTADGHVDLTRVFGSAYSSGESTSATVTVTNNGGSPCQYIVALPNKKAGRALLSSPTAYYGTVGGEVGDGVAYEVKSGAQVLVGDVEGSGSSSVVASANQVLSGTLAPGTSQGHQLTLSIPPRQLVPYVEGGYSDTIDITVYEGPVGAAMLSSDPQNKAAIKVSVDVKPDVRMSLTPVGGAAVGLWAGNAHDVSADYTIDFGDMTKGNVQQQIQLHVASNDGYEISFVSDNGGRLKNKGAIPHLKTEASSVIDYTMSVNGTPIPLSGQSAFTADAITQPAGTLVSSSLLMTFLVGDTSHALAGDYGDVITVTISNPS